MDKDNKPQPKLTKSIGLKYYRYLDDKLEIIRILRYYNTEDILVLTEDNKKIKINRDQLSKYVKLNSDGIMVFNIVNLGSEEDVMISLHRREDILKTQILPYAICRQNIRDLFEYTLKGDLYKTSLGLSVSKDTLPQGYDYKTLFAAEGVIETQYVNVYIDDDLDTILQFVQQLNMNNTLSKLKKTFQSLEYVSTSGACSTVKELLETNDFMMEFDRGFKIIKLDSEIKYNDEHCMDLKVLIEFANKTSISIEPQNTFVLEYDKTIDLSKISEDHVLIRDKNNKLFIMLYNNKKDITPNRLDEFRYCG